MPSGTTWNGASSSGVAGRRLRSAAAPLRLPAALRRAPTPTSTAGRDGSVELSAEGGVFSNDFLIPLAFDRRARRYRGDLADRFGVLQVRVNRRDDDACLNRNQIDTNQRDTEHRSAERRER